MERFQHQYVEDKNRRVHNKCAKDKVKEYIKEMRIIILECQREQGYATTSSSAREDDKITTPVCHGEVGKVTTLLANRQLNQVYKIMIKVSKYAQGRICCKKFCCV